MLLIFRYLMCFSPSNNRAGSFTRSYRVLDSFLRHRNKLEYWRNVAREKINNQTISDHKSRFRNFSFCSVASFCPLCAIIRNRSIIQLLLLLRAPKTCSFSIFTPHVIYLLKPFSWVIKRNDSDISLHVW